MAKSDGTVYIDTKIDTSGVGKGMVDTEKKVSAVSGSFKKLGNSIKKAFSSNSVGGSEKSYESIQKEIDKVSRQLDKVIEKQIRFVETGGNIKSRAFAGMEYDIESYRQKLEELKTEQSRFAKGENTQKSRYQFDSLRDSVEKLGKKAKTSFSYLAKLAGKSMLGGLKKVGSAIGKMSTSIFSLNKNTKNANYSMLKMLGTSVLFSGVFRAISAVTNGFKEGMNNLVQYSDEANVSMSALKSALTQLKNSLATAFSPILTIITPALVGFINLLSKAASAVGAFFSALSGKSTYTKAVAVQEDYAESLADTSKNAKDAKKSLNQYLSGLDEIKTFTPAQDSEDKKGITPSEMFTEEQIAAPISVFAEKVKSVFDTIKKLFQEQDWDGLGQYLAGGLNKALQYLYEVLNWDNIGEKITPIITGITSVFNSLVSGFDWQLLGETIGAGVNTIINSLNLLLNGVDWVNLGSSIATSVNGLFSEIDWVNLGLLLGTQFMVLWDTFKGFVTTLDFTSIGTSIGQMINGALERIDLGQIVITLFTFAIGILEALTAAIKEVDWSKVGQQICEALKAIDWVGLAKGLWDAGIALVGGLLEAFGELPAPIQLVIDLFAGFLVASKLMEIGSFITGSIIPAITKMIAYIIGNGGIIGAIKALASTLGTGGVIGIAIAAAVALILLLIQNWDKVVNAMKSVDDFLQNIFTKDWTESFGIFGEALNGFFANCKNIWDATKKIFTGIIDFIAGVFTGDWERAWNGVKDILAGVFDLFVAVIKAPINGVIALINGLISGVVAGINLIIRGLNSLKFEVPDWVPFIGGSKLGFNIREMVPFQIPYLATGAVIPPNAPFLAMLGDQKHGTNIEAPLDTIKQAVAEVIGNGRSGGGSYQFIAQIDRRTLFEEMIDEALLQQDITGRNPFELE